MNDIPLLSVIIPVYNCEAYLRRCLDSVCGQTYHNIEIVLVNDGSSDGSESICKEYQQQDQRIRVINQRNQGSSFARNTGLQHATGDLVSFIDSDDWIHPDMFERLYRILEKHAADIALCDVESEGKPEHPDWKDGTFTGKDQIFSEYIQGRVINRVYNKLYRIETVRGVSFPVGRNMMEDASWTPRVLEKANCITRIAEPLYSYTDNEAGITHSKASHIKICSRFANLLDREAICLKYAVDSADKQIIAKELIRYIRQMMETSDNLELFDISQRLTEVVIKNREILEQNAKKEEIIMLEAVVQGDLVSAKKQYKRAVWLYGHSIKDKLRLILQWLGKD